MTREDFLRHKIESLGTLKEFSQKINMPYSTLLSILKNVGGASVDNIIKICSGLSISTTVLENIPNTPISTEKKIPSFDYIHIPYGIAAGALETCEAMTELPTVNLPDFLLGKYARNKNIVIMHVNGESMNNVIKNGATIAVLTHVALENIHDGDIVVAATAEGTYTIKHFFNDKKNRQIVLRPDSTDPSFTERRFDYTDEREFNIFGKVVIYSVNL